MALDVIGAGFGRTGTLSLKRALEQLGFSKCYHMSEVFRHDDHVERWEAAVNGDPIDWDELFAGYRATVDWPSAGFWRELVVRYPDAKVILTTREPHGWFRSIHSTIYPTSVQALESDDPRQRRWAAWANELIWERDLEGHVNDEGAAIEVFERHAAAVQATLPAERLLVFQATDGWEPLCDFLGTPVPAEPYPLTNTTEEFQERSRR